MDVRFLIVKTALLILACDDVIAQVIVTPMLGADATLPCLITPGTTGQVTWSHEDRILTIGRTTIYDKKRLSVQTPSTNEYILFINSVKREDERTFTCKVGSTVFATVKVEIQAKPSWNEDETSPASLEPNEYTDVKLNCRASGRPEPVITWYREENGKVVEQLQVTGYQLIIYNITRFQTDDYRCTARNKHDEISRTISVDVTFPPEVHIHESEVSRATSEDAVFTCVIQGSPVDKVFWKTNNGATVPETNHWKYKVFRESLSGYPVTFLTLVLKKGQWGSYDYGTYKCIAVGPFHQASASVALKIPVERTEEKETVVKNYN